MKHDLTPGAVVRYPYLWAWQHERGETEGRKERPVCLAVTVERAGQTIIYLLPISGTPPGGNQVVIEIPVLERARAGLDQAKDAWITVSEFNRDRLEQSFYLEPEPPLGAFSASFLTIVLRAFRRHARNPAAMVDRT
jgi:hypothetical protein